MNWDVKPRRFDRLSNTLGIDLWVQEEYLLPFPFAGNKWVKLIGQHGSGKTGAAYITNGGISSNHCRTLAVWSAFHGHRCHLVLHNDKEEDGTLPLDFLSRLGATYTVVKAAEIAETISLIRRDLDDDGYDAVVVPGGGHSSEAVRAYADYASQVLVDTDFEHIFLASGTGGTQAGICIANHEVGSGAKVVGISVARASSRGKDVVQTTIRETVDLNLEVHFRDEYVDGGYGPGSCATENAIDIAGRGGLILDSTYTGKAFAGLIDAVRTGDIASGAKVLYWHTGGTYLAVDTGTGRRS